MTFKRLIFFGFCIWVLLGAVKYLCFNSLDISATFDQILFAFLVAAVSAAIIRRVGVINYFEAVIAAVFWFIGSVLLDYYLLRSLFGSGFFGKWQTWAGYGVMMLAILIFHRKRHVELRKEIKSQHGH